MRECRHTRPDWCRHPAQGLRHSLYRQFRWEHTKSGSFLDRLKNNKYVHFSCLTFCHWFSFQFNKHVWGFGPSCELFEFLCVLLGIKIGFGWAFWYQTIKWRWFWNFLHIKSGTRCRPASTVYSTIMWMCIRIACSVGDPAGGRVQPRVLVWRPRTDPGCSPQVRPDRPPRDVTQGCSLTRRYLWILVI